MKKFRLWNTCLTAAMCFFLAAAFAACADGKGDGGEGGEGGSGTRYSVQAPETSDVYTVAGLPDGAYAGDEVAFTVTLTHPADSVLESVTVRGSATGEKELTGQSGKYTFLMPAEPVRVAVEAAYYPDNATDNFLSWREGNIEEVEIWQAAFDGDSYFDFSDDAELHADVTSSPVGSGGMFTVHEERAFSLNEDVIPNEALSVEVTTGDMNNFARAFTVRIDRTMLRAGTAKVVLAVENGHKFGDEAVLACTLTVRAPAPLEKIETWEETVVIYVSDVETEDLYFTFEDLDYEDTMYLQQYQTILEDEYEVVGGKVTLVIRCAVGHEYAVSLAYRTGDPPPVPAIRIKSADGGTFESTPSGGVLTFAKEHAVIELELS